MKQTINFNQFCDSFSVSGQKDNFTYEGKKALFEYLENNEEEIGEEIELDPIALCWEYTEYENIDDYLQTYNTNIVDKKDYENEEDYKKAVEEYIQEETQFIPIYDYKGHLLENFIILDY